MFTPSGWTILVLKKMNLRWCPESDDEPQVGEEEVFYNRMLWAIPEEEEDSAIKARHPIQLRKSDRCPKPHQGRDCICTKKNGGMHLQVKPKFLSPIKQMRRNVRIANSEIDGNILKSTDDKYPVQLSLIPPRKRADEDELSYQCDEISQLYQAVSQGKVSLDNLRVLGLSLRI